MVTIGSFDAKTHLAKLLERVAHGETIQITKRGIPIAKLVPPDEHPPRNRRKLAEDIRHLRQGLTLKGTRLRSLIEEGRRY